MNPYAPPKAELADQVDRHSVATTAPSTVIRAVWLIAVSLALGVLKIMLVPIPGPLWVALAVVAVFAAFTVAIARGANWARITFLVLFVLGLPSVFLIREQLLREGTISVAVMSLQTGLQLSAVVLLFLPPSSGWFREGGKAKTQRAESSENG